eukprot:scaffold4427_cov139-Amphora_coffeaeformis.AAC.2
MPDFDGHPTSGLPCLLARNSAQLKCAIPLCEACELARACKRPTGATTKTPVPETIDSIRADDLEPGLDREDRKYCGGTLFYDHASGRIFVRHQTSLSSHESILAKDAFEQEAALCGFSIKKYRTDNGITHLRIIDKHSLKDNLQLDPLLALITKTASLKQILVVSKEWHALCSFICDYIDLAIRSRLRSLHLQSCSLQRQIWRSIANRILLWS